MSLGRSLFRLGNLGLLILGSACHSGESSATLVTPTAPPVGAEIVASVIPAPDATGVLISAVVSVQFNLPMNPASFTPATLALYQGENQIAGSVSSSGLTATFTPASKLGSKVPLRAVIAAGVLTASGQPLGQDYEWKFTTQDLTPIQVVSHFPIMGQTLVPLATKISVDFSEDVGPASVTASSFQLLGPSGAVAGLLTQSGPASVLFTPASLFQGDTLYTATVSGITDLFGNGISPPYSWSFRSIETVPPTVVSTVPVASNPIATNVPVDVVPKVVFSEPMDLLSITAASFELRDKSGALVPGVASLDQQDLKTLTLTLAAPLKDGRVYSARVKGTVKDAAGNPMGPDFVWSFQTAPFQHGIFDLVEGEDLGNANSVQAVMDPETGEVYAVWRMQGFDEDSNGTKTNDSYVIFGSHYDPATELWDAPKQLSVNFSDDAVEPVIAMDTVRKTVFAAWAQEFGTGASAEIQALPYDKNQYGGWADPLTELKTVSQYGTGSGKVSGVQIAADLGTGFFRLAWIHEDFTGAGYNRSIATSVVDPALLFGGSSGWSAQEAIDPAATGLIYRDLRLAIDSDNQVPYVVYAASGPPFSLFGSAKGATGWLAPVLLETNNLNTTNANLEDPSLIIDPLTGDALVGWRQKMVSGNQAKFDVMFQRFRFDPPTQTLIFPNCPNPNSAPCPTTLNFSTVNHAGAPSMAVDPSGNVMLVWSQIVPFPPGDGQASLYGALFGAGTSTNPTRLLAENISAVPCDNPRLAFAGPADRNFFIAFTQDTAGKGGMWKSLYQPATGWSNPALNLEPLTGLPVNSTGGNVLLSDGKGIGFCLWERTPTGAGAVRSVVSNRFP